MLAGLGFRSGEFAVLVVHDVAPSEAVPDHLHVDEAIAEVNPPDFAAVRSTSITSMRTV
jgi:hypothetical protein